MRCSTCSALLFVGLLGCSATVPGPSQVRPGWDGSLSGGGRLGVYLLTARSPLTVAQFECMSQGEGVLEGMDPALRWIPIDSGSKGVRELGGWDLDSLGDLLVADSAVWRAAPAAAPAGISTASPSVSGPVRQALGRVGKAYGVGRILVVRPGSLRNAKDSAKDFRDAAWFGLFEASTGEQLYSLSVPVQGARSAARSAEADWAREAWKSLARGVESVRSR